MKVAVCCRSNMNRSMEAHLLLKKRGFQVRSFGTGRRCKLPGASADTPALFNFGVPYADMVRDLQERDRQLFTRNGVLRMLERNAKVKVAPERWQDQSAIGFDLVITFEERVYDSVLDDLRRRSEESDGGTEPIHVVNLETRDKMDEAVQGAQLALELCESVCFPCLTFPSTTHTCACMLSPLPRSQTDHGDWFGSCLERGALSFKD